MPCRMIERWLDTGSLGEPLDERTARILRDWEDEGFCHYATTTDENGHRHLRFRKPVPDPYQVTSQISFTSF
jgi:hypothetical protein